MKGELPIFAQSFKVLTYALIPIGTILGGGAWAALHPPGPKARSALQHFAAGLVFAAVAVGILPGMAHERSPLAATVGFAVGVTLVLLVERLSEAKGVRRTEGGLKAEGCTNLLVMVGVTVAIDGLLIGVCFAADAKAGVVLTGALAVEVMFLGLTAAVALEESGASCTTMLGACTGLAALLLAGVGVGAVFLGTLSGVALKGVLSFGCVALIYLVTEGLVTDATEEAGAHVQAAMFLVGFVVLLIGVLVT